MTSQLNPYVSFDGNAREALEFYQGVFGGELTMNTFGQYGDAEAPNADKIMHGMVTSPKGYMLMASDLMPGMDHQTGNNHTISLSGDDADELRGYFEKLGQGGTVTVPLEKQVWGDEFGQCVDKFGVPWMVDIYPAG